MAGDGEDETEYESDPEEAKMSLKMRRREASDDEDEQEEREREREREVSQSRVSIVDSEGESDGQGGAANYDEDDDDDGEEYYDEAEEEVVEGEGEGEYEEREIGSVAEAENRAREVVVVEEKGVEETVEGNEAKSESQGQGEEEKKENEPFAVPTSGAFYMHDDRFRDNAAGRHRRTLGGRRLWESKDDRKWGHDKFEELNTQERCYEEGRRPSKGYNRGRGKGRGADRGYAQGNRTRGFGGNSNHNVAPKDVRGRGPRRYQPSMKNKSETLPSQNKQSAKSLDRSLNTGFGRNSASTAHPNADHESVPAKKVASNLNSASPPFYPSGSSNKETALTTKREAQAGSNNRSLRPSVAEHTFSMPLSNSVFRGKNVNDSIGMEKLHIDDSVSPTGAKAVNNMHVPSSASSSSASQMPQSRAQGRGATPSASSVFQPPQISNQVSRALPPAAQALQQNPGQNRGQAPVQASGQQLDQRALGASQQGSSPPKAGKGTVQGAGRGSLVYGGTQVMGSGGGMTAGDPNLPAFFPVMPFGGQHPGGMGVPPVGMAFPGYVAQPNGLGNSEMTWLPVLASAAGALGATYCPPYIAVDGSYHPRPTGQTSALPGPSKDNNSPSKPNNELKPQPRSEDTHDEFSQRQNKPRRYSEMNFSQ